MSRTTSCERRGREFLRAYADVGGIVDGKDKCKTKRDASLTTARGASGCGVTAKASLSRDVTDASMARDFERISGSLQGTPLGP